MKKTILAIFLLLSSGLIMSLNAQGIVRTLYPSDDTYTYSDNTIRGMETTINTYHTTASAVFFRISYLKFDISSLSPFAKSVKIRIYTNGFLSGGDLNHEFDIYPVKLSNWSEDDVTYTNYVAKTGEDVTSPLLASYTVAAGLAFSPQYIEFSADNLFKYVTDSLAAGNRYISFKLREKNTVKRNSKGVVVEFHSKENISGFAPELVVEEKDVELLKASEINVNNIPISSFTENNYVYKVIQAWNATEIPVVTATAKHAQSSVSVTQASSLSGTIDSRSAKVSIQNGTDKLTYSVVFELSPLPIEARLSDIKVDGKSIEFFEMDKENYLTNLPYTQNVVPTVTVQPFDPYAHYQMVTANSIVSSESEINRTTTLNVTSANGTVTKTYKILFNKLPELDLVLAIGQSNMAGRGYIVDETAPMENVYLLTPAAEMEIASNPMNKYSNVRKDLSLQRMSPSYTCALKLQTFENKPIGFVVNAQGGSSITTWYQPGTSNYDGTITRAKDAQRFGKYRAIIWHQGESNDSQTSTYMGRLSTMVQNLRTELNEPNLFFVAGELAYWRGEGTASNAFNALIRTISSSISNSSWVSAEELMPYIDETDPHFDGPSQKILGERYADRIIENMSSTAVNNVTATYIPTMKLNNQSLLIENKDVVVKYCINDISGRTIKIGQLLSNQSENIQLSSGVYLVTYTQNNTKTTVKTVII